MYNVIDSCKKCRFIACSFVCMLQLFECQHVVCRYLWILCDNVLIIHLMLKSVLFSNFIGFVFCYYCIWELYVNKKYQNHSKKDGQVKRDFSESGTGTNTVHRLYDMSRLVTKSTKSHMRPAKTQISLGIRPVWSVFAVIAALSG